MGQISLPRVNRLGVSMFWENSSVFSKYQFHSLKLYIFIKYFTRYFFYYSYFNFLQSTKIKSKFLITSNIKSFTKTNNIEVRFTDKVKNRVGFFKDLRVYIYSFYGKFYILFIYLNSFNIKYRKKWKFKRRITSFIKSSLYL